jgi:predicted RNase H-related nuclease YkuK (DUF458 family)
VLDKDWFTLDGDLVEIKQAIQEATKGDDKVVFIGTDSQKFNKTEDFVTVIVVYTISKGGRVFYTLEKDPKFHNLRDKLIKEALLSIQTAWAIAPILPDDCKIAALHADVNTDIKKGKSAKFESQIVGMIKGNGFPVVTKPDGWASSHIAEHIVKRKHERSWSQKRKNVANVKK